FELQRFVAEPEKFLAQKTAESTAPPIAMAPNRWSSKPLPTVAAKPAAASDTRIHTCPMHPEIRQVGPGSCPKCGMALEPVETTADEGPNPELVDMSRRFWWSALLTAPLLALVMGEMLW